MATSSTPLGTESGGLSTSNDTAITVLSWAAYSGQKYWIFNGGTVRGFYKTSDDSEWQPFLPGRTYNLRVKDGDTAFAVQVKRIPSGSNVTSIDSGVFA